MKANIKNLSAIFSKNLIVWTQNLEFAKNTKVTFTTHQILFLVRPLAPRLYLRRF